MCRVSSGACTAWLLKAQLGQPEATAHRVIRDLKALGVVEPILKVPQRRVKRSGPMPKVWGLVGHCSDEEVARAVTLHYRTLSPKYRAAEKVALSILDEYRVGVQEVSYRDIVLRVKEMKIPFKSPDIADLAAQYLHEKGIKVWR
jgi:DNA-binding IclR family transcriptional regulator